MPHTHGGRGYPQGWLPLPAGVLFPEVATESLFGLCQGTTSQLAEKCRTGRFCISTIQRVPHICPVSADVGRRDLTQPLCVRARLFSRAVSSRKQVGL